MWFVQYMQQVHVSQLGIWILYYHIIIPNWSPGCFAKLLRVVPRAQLNHIITMVLSRLCMKYSPGQIHK